MKTFIYKPGIGTTALLVVNLFLMMTGTGYAQTRTSNATGNWNVAATWSNTNINRTGTVSASTANNSVTGSGTSFTTELTVGSVIQTQGGTAIGTVATIISNTSLTLTANASSNVSGQTYRTISGPPSPVDNVNIANGNTVTVSANATCNSLNIGTNNNVSALTISSGITLTVTTTVRVGDGANNANRRGNLTFNNGSLLICNALTHTRSDAANNITMTAGGTLRTGSIALAGSGSTAQVFTPGAGTVELTATNTLPSSVFTSFNNLTISSGTTTAAVGFSVGGLLNIASGATLNMATFAMTGASLTTSGTGTLQTQAQTTPLPTGRTWSGTVQYNRTAGAQDVMAGTYNNLTLSNTSGTQTASGAITVNGTLTTTVSGTLNMGTNQLLGSLTSITNGGTLQTQNTSATPVPTGKTWGGTLQYNGTGQTVVPGTYDNLTLSGSGTKTFGGVVVTNGLTSVAAGIVVNPGSVTTHTSNTLSLGGNGTASGTFGSISSAALNQSNTFFSPGSTGYITVATGTCTAPTITLGSISSVCQTASSFSIPYSATTGSPDVYSISGTGITTVSEAALPISPITANFTVTGVPPSMAFTLTVKNSNTGCVSSNINSSVTVSANPTTAAAGSNQTICFGATTLAANTATTGSGVWSILAGSPSTSTGQLSSTSNPAATFTPTLSGTYTLRWTISNNPCTPSTDDVTVIVNPLPQVASSGFSGNTICSSGTGQLTITTSAGTGPFNAVINGQAYIGISSGVAFNVLPSSPVSTTNYTLTSLTDNNGCPRTGSFTDAAATVTVFSPLTSISYSANPAVYCPGVAITTNTPTVVGGVVTSYSVSPSLPAGLSLNTGTGQITGTPTVSLAAANYTVTATNACGSATVDVNIRTEVSALTTTPGARCGTGIVALSSTTNTSCFTPTINWYAAATGGSSLGSGSGFNTPSISATTTYFAEESFTTGETTIGTGNSTSTDRGLVFTLFEQVVLRSVQVHNNSGTGNITVALRNSSGGTVSGVSDVTQSVTTGVNTVTLNWTIPAGTNYRILYSSGTRELRRTDPYTFPESLGVGLITGRIESGSFGTNRYHYFYNWVIARTRVSATATVNSNPTITLGTSPSVSRSTTSANLPYTATTGSPDQYSIDYNAAAEAQGFVDVTNASLPASPVVLTIPATAAAATYNATISVRNSSTGCTSVSGAAFTVTVQPVGLTITGVTADNKTYDGNTTASVSGTPAYDGLVNGESFSVSGSPVATFNNKHVGTGKPVSVSGYLPPNANYTVTQPSLSADIEVRNITVTAVTDTKIYDGNTSSAGVPAYTLQAGDVTATVPTQIFDTKHAGTNKVLTASGLVINDGNSGNNYNIAYVTNNTGEIQVRNITVTAVTDTKFYDGNNSSSGVPTYTLQPGDATGTAPVQTFDNANVGTGKVLTAGGLVINDGNSGNNYNIGYAANNTGVINQLAITVTPDAGQFKVFGDANPTYTYTASPSLISPDVFSGSLSRVAGEAIGFYNYTLGTLSASGNYSVSLGGSNTFEIQAVGQANADFRSQAAGNFSAAATWEFDLGGGNWQNATQAPGINNNVSISHAVILDQNFTVGAAKNFTLASGGSFTVNPDRTITIAGAANFGGQQVTFKSDATGYGSLGPVTGSLTGASNVTVERYLPNPGFRAWRLLSVPTHGSQTIRQAWQEGNTPMSNNNPGYGTLITGGGNNTTVAQANGFDYSGPNTSMQFWNGNGWTNISGTSAPLSAQQAYFLYVRGDRGKGVSGNINDAGNTILRSNGNLYTGTQTFNVPEGKFQVIPNLYPSAISFTALSRSGISNSFTIWDSKTRAGNQLGKYITFSGTNDWFPSVSSNSYPALQPNTLIESGQAFFVQDAVLPAGGGSISLVETAKTSASANGNLGLRPVNRAKLRTTLYSGDTELDGNVVVFDAAFSNAYDADDASKLGNPGANFGIELKGKILSVEGRQPAAENDEVRFRMWNLEIGAYSLTLEAGRIAPAGTEAVLEDQYTRQSTLLNLNGSTTLNFSVNSDAASKAANRFRVVFRKNSAGGDVAPSISIAPNPVDNGHFTIRLTGKVNGKYTVMVRTTDGKQWAAYTLQHEGGTTTRQLALPANTASGIYQLESIAPDRTRTNTRLFVLKR